MQAIKQMLNRAMKLKQSSAWIYAIDVEVKDEIIRLNTEDQLEEEGIDSEGDSLGEYSPVTKQIKTLKAQRIDHVTLRDTGAFYNSFKIVVTRNSFKIIADDVSLYDEPLTDVYGLDILGLTDENKAFLNEYIKENLQEYVLLLQLR